MNLAFPTTGSDSSGSGVASVAVSGGLLTLGGTASNPVIGLTPADIQDLLTRPVQQIWVGGAINPAVTATGAAHAPFAELADAAAWIATQTPGACYYLHCSPQAYAPVTLPAQFCGVIDAGAGTDSGNVASIASVTIEATGGGWQPKWVFRGFAIDTLDTADTAGGGTADVALFRMEGAGTLDGYLNNGGVTLTVEGAGVVEPNPAGASVRFTGNGNKGTGVLNVVTNNVDVQGSVVCSTYYSNDCFNPNSVTADVAIVVNEAEGENAFYGAPTYSCPNGMQVDQGSASAFLIAGGALSGGGQFSVDDGPLTGFPAGVTALVAGEPTYVFDSGGGILKLGRIDGTQQTVMHAFVGFTQLTTAAVNDAQLIAGDGARVRLLTGLTPGKGYYISGGVGASMTVWTLFSEDDLDTFVADVPANTWYRYVGVADLTSTLRTAWGQPTAT